MAGKKVKEAIAIIRKNNGDYKAILKDASNLSVQLEENGTWCILKTLTDKQGNTVKNKYDYNGQFIESRTFKHILK